jgi:predicted DNA-binding transcriptional regulator AlpA
MAEISSDQSAISRSLLNEREVAKLISISLASVRRWRLFSQGPRFLKIGSSVRYRVEDVEAWLKARPTGGERLVG